MVASPDRSLLCPVLIGRATHLDAFDVILARVVSGHGETVLLRGDAGVGKSRLLRELHRVATERDCAYLQGACFEPDRALPYGPILDLLRALAAGPLGADLAEVVGGAAGEIVALLPELGPRLPEAVAARTSEPEREKRRFFEALVQVFTGLAMRRPLVLGIEDLHWCDDTSLEFLQLLAQRGVAQPLLLILTYRDDEVNPALRHFLAQLDRSRLATEWPLEPLNLDQVDAMLRAIFRLDRPARPDFVAALFDLTEGNPFFIEETLKALAEAGDIYYIDGQWDRKATTELDIPRSVQDAVQRRTERLTPEARAALAQASVIGKRFQFALLQTLTGCDESDLLQILKELIAAQLVVEVSDEQFAFRHALTRKAVYSGLLARERKTLHRSVAETMARLYGSSNSMLDTHLADLADHFYAAGVWEQALEYGQRSGTRALALFAPRAAIEHFTHALDAAYQLGRPAPAQLLLARGEAYETLGELERARLDYERASERARSDDDGQMEWRSLMALGLFWAGREYRQAGAWFRQASALAESLGDPLLQAHSFNRLANWYVNIGRTTEAIRMHQRALTIFDERRHQPGIAETLDLLGMAHLLHGDAINSKDYFGRAIDLLRAQGNIPGLVSALTSRAISAGPANAATSYSPLGTPAECLRDAEEARALALKIESLSAQVYLDTMTAWWLASFGDFGAAHLHAHAALATATEIGHQQWIVATECILGRLWTLMLDTTQAIQILEPALASARALGSVHWEGTIRTYLADAYTLGGATEQARALLEVAIPAHAHPYNLAERQMLWAWSTVALAEGDAPAALRIVERLIASAPGAPDAQPIPWLLKTKGDALAALADLEAAAQTLEAAATGAAQRQERPLLWQIQLALGRVQLRLKDHDQAERAFSAARGVVAELAASIAEPLARERFLAATSKLLPPEKRLPDRRARAERYGGLTEREREVASLIAAGKTNREIAAELVVSRRTIDTHVSAILAKLCVSSRARIAIWAVEVGLVNAPVIAQV